MEAQATRTANRTPDLVWQARPLAELLRLAWPIAVSTLSYSAMTLVDTLLVGHLGAAQLAGVGLGGTLAFALLCFPMGLLRGVKTLVSQAIGAERRDEVGALLAAALVSALGLGVVVIALGQLVAEGLARLVATAAAGEAARTYLKIRNLGAPAALVYVALREVRYGQSDARAPMVATVIANVVNVALATLFVYGLHRGVAGAATATVTANAVEAATLALLGRQPGGGASTGLRAAVRVPLGALAPRLAAVWRIGLPTGVQFTLEIGSFALLATLISRLSELQMAAHQIALQTIHFSFLPAFAVGEAASVLAGQAVGADRDDLVQRVARLALATAGAYTGGCTLVLAAVPGAIVAAFTPDPAVSAVAINLLHVAAVFQVFDAANIVARSILRGSGDVRFAAAVGIVTSWALTPPLTWLLGYRAGLGAFGGWLGLCAEIIAGSAILWWRLERRHWLPAAVESRARLAV